MRMIRHDHTFIQLNVFEMRRDHLQAGSTDPRSEG
jgi:hypothetical protein